MPGPTDDLPREPTSEAPRPGWAGDAVHLLKVLLSEASVTLVAILAIIGVQYWNQYVYLDQITRDLGEIRVTLGTVNTKLDSMGEKVTAHEDWIQLGRVHVLCIEGQVTAHGQALDIAPPPCAERMADVIMRPGMQ